MTKKKYQEIEQSDDEVIPLRRMLQIRSVKDFNQLLMAVLYLSMVGAALTSGLDTVKQADA